ncbi:cytochrome P450 2J6-like [Dreissena polymorpha]|uniref:Cytochrome P450 n=1 Tax=Dreissena polymorpha TaxID=45954 RepID=A0A9D4RFM8_DREPO|nr:cytochrome P450 2J6-like [Dreissena polymorpha]KAH3864887.1 hypothetical protein DPMN_027918 [Dreissena polymorpha]
MSIELKRPPGPRCWPIVGNLLQLSGSGMFYEKLNTLRKQHGDVVYIELGALKLVVLFGHEKVKKALTAQPDSFKYRPQWLVEISSFALFNGIVWSNGPLNEKLRRFAGPSVWPGLGDQTLEQRVQIEATALVMELTNQKGNSETLKTKFFQAISNINCAIIFGSRYEYSDAEFQEFSGLMDRLLQRQGINNPLNFIPILQYLPEGKKVKEMKVAIKKMCEFLAGKVKAARSTFDKSRARSLVDLYLSQEHEQDPVTEENVFHIVRDFFVAGTENVAIGLLWLIGYMVRYGAVQGKCRECIQKIVGDKSAPSQGDIKQMPYVEATVQEVLRLANIAPLSVPHATVEEAEFEGYSIPRETMVLTHLQSVHLDPAYWDDPEVFRPERFLRDGVLIQNEAYYPFSIGSRYCLAAKLAHMELTLIFTTLLKNFTFPSDASCIPTLKCTQPGAFVEPEVFNVTCNALTLSPLMK